MSRLKNLYTNLITNRRPEVDDWLDGYLAFTAEVAKVVSDDFVGVSSRRS